MFLGFGGQKLSQSPRLQVEIMGDVLKGGNTTLRQPADN